MPSTNNWLKNDREKDQRQKMTVKSEIADNSATTKVNEGML